MDPKETTQALMNAIQGGHFEKARSLLTDDFVFSGPVPKPVNGPAWLDMSKNLKAAFPDLDYQFKIKGVNGNVVNISAQLKGTHKGDLDLTAMGMGVVPATGKAVVFPTSTIRISFDGDKISRIHDPATDPDAGPAGFFKAIGVEMG